MTQHHAPGGEEPTALVRAERTRSPGPRSVPWAVDGETDVVAVDTTWGELQPVQIAPGVRTVGELELLAFVEQGAVLVDGRTDGSFGGPQSPDAVRQLLDAGFPATALAYYRGGMNGWVTLALPTQAV